MKPPPFCCLRTTPTIQEVFPLFATLPDLSFQNFTTFFQACRNLESLDKPLLNQALGEFQGVLQLVALLFENGAIGRIHCRFSLYCNLRTLRQSQRTV